MKKFLLIIFITSCCYSQQQFTSDKYGFSINFPNGWNVEKETASMVAVIARLNNSTSINIIVQDKDPSQNYNIAQIDAESFKQDLELKYKEHFKSYKTLDYGRATVNLYNALFITYSCDFNGEIIKTKQYFIFRDSGIYIISAGAPEAEFQNLSETFNECLNSFKFN